MTSPKKQKIDDFSVGENPCSHNEVDVICHKCNVYGRKFLFLENELCKELLKIDYGEKVAFIYNPLQYAKELHEDYVLKYCKGPKAVLLVGMNPGPWGMGQTGVPFGHVGHVKNWLKIKGNVQKPAFEHPKRLVEGLNCTKNEVSGDRMWKLLEELSGTPDVLFRHIFLHNYCPLSFMKDSAKNITPPELKIDVRRELENACDESLIATVKFLEVKNIVAIGNYVAKKIEKAFERHALLNIKIFTLMHPSPVNPAANKGWREIAMRQLTEAGIIHLFGSEDNVSYN